MPFCPECQAEYRDGFTRCAECDLDLVEQLPEAFDTSEENIKRALEGKELVSMTLGRLEVVKEARDLLAESVTISVSLDEPSQVTVRYGTSCAAPSECCPSVASWLGLRHFCS